MINKQDVIDFFDKLSVHWDQDAIEDEHKIEMILNYAGIKSGSSVLDVACGTGILVPYYLKRKVKNVVGVDISSKMIEIAKDKYADCDSVDFCIGDMEEIELDQQFDCVMVYNAFPHFTNPQKLIKQLAGHLKENGVLCVAHGMSRAEIDSCHRGKAKHVSNGLIHENKMEKLFEPYFEVETKVSNQDLYVVVGKKRNFPI